MSTNISSMFSGPVGPPTGGRFEFEDGGLYVGAWEDGKAHGYGICTGPKNQGEYDGLWQCGFEASGVYTWPSNHTYAGQWGAGKRNGLGVENKGKWSYKGEWTFGFKGRYGVRESTESGAKYEGTWTTGLQDGYGVETYADLGTYSGQWMRGARHGYGVRRSATFGVAARYANTHQRSASITSLPSHDDADKQLHERDKMISDNRGGFVLTAFSDSLGSSATLTDNTKMGAASRSTSLDKQTGSVRKSLFKRLKKQKSTGDLALESQNPNARNVTGSLRSTASSVLNYPTDSSLTLASKKSNSSFVHHGFGEDQLEPNVVEIYLGEWKNDKRSGVGVCERSDGLKYEGEWYNNKKNGYGRTMFRDGRKEEGKYKNNVLVASEKKHKLLSLRLSKLKERVDTAVHSAKQASEIALQKAEIASARQQTARACGDDAEKAASEARCNAEYARQKAREYGYVPATGQSPANGRPGAASSTNADENKYESKYADADFRPDDKGEMLMRSAVLQELFDRYAPNQPNESSKPQLSRLPSSTTLTQQTHALVEPVSAAPQTSYSVSPSVSLPEVAVSRDSAPVTTVQPKAVTRYTTVTSQTMSNPPQPAVSTSNSNSNSNGGPRMQPVGQYTKHVGNHVTRPDTQRAASQTRFADSSAAAPPQPSRPQISTTSPNVRGPNSPPIFTNTMQAPVVAAAPAPPNAVRTMQQPMGGQQSANSTMVRRAPAPLPDANSLAYKGATMNSTSAARNKRRGSLPDVTGTNQPGMDGELSRLKDEVLRRREQERAWRESPVGLVVHRINHTLEWCNRHTGFVVVLTVLSINFLFICIFLSYYNNSFSQAAADKRDSGL